MRLKIFLLSAILAPFISHGQLTGVTGGITLCDYRNMTLFNSAATGYTAGMFFIKDSAIKHFAVQTGLNYTLLSGHGDVKYYNLVNDLVLSYNKHQNLHMIQLPVVLQWAFVRGEHMDMGLGAGLNYSFLIQARHNPQPQSMNHDVTDNFNRNIIGGLLSLNAGFKLRNNKKASVCYSYNRSFNQLHKTLKKSGFEAHSITLAFAFNSIRSN